MHVRTARPQDALAVETVRLRGWQQAYRDLVPEDYLAAMAVDVERRQQRMADPAVTTLVAEEAEEVVGMGVAGPSRDGLAERELYALYVDPSCWRTGVGSALLEGLGEVSVLWVLEGNARAQAFYERHGFAPDGGSQVLELGGPVTEIRMRRG